MKIHEGYRPTVQVCIMTTSVIFIYDTTYDMKDESNVDEKFGDQLNLAHVARKKCEKEKTKTNKCQCPLSSVLQFKIHVGSPEGIRMTMEERICERDES